MLTVSPNKQYRGLSIPITPAATGPVKRDKGKVKINKINKQSTFGPYQGACQSEAKF